MPRTTPTTLFADTCCRLFFIDASIMIPVEIGWKSRDSACFRSCAMLSPAWARSAVAALSVIQPRTPIGAASEASRGSKRCSVELELTTTCHGYPARSGVWTINIPAAPRRSVDDQHPPPPAPRGFLVLVGPASVVRHRLSAEEIRLGRGSGRVVHQN